jgi:hypothetical protein
MDLNPKAAEHLDPAVKFLFQDCSLRWDLPDQSLTSSSPAISSNTSPINSPSSSP